MQFFSVKFFLLFSHRNTATKSQ